VTTDRHLARQLIVRVPPDMHQRLVDASLDHDVAVNWLVNKAIHEFMDRLLPASEVRWTRPVHD
jgi:predicted HicB family RNase H-like nuclease